MPCAPETAVAAASQVAGVPPTPGMVARSLITTLLGVDVGAVSVKASSGNLSGVEGAGRAISANAVAVVEPLERSR